MERRSTALIAVVIIGLALGTVGCQQKSPGDTGDTSGTGGGFETDTGAVEERSSVDLVEFKTIYFDYDQSSIRSDQRGNLRADADMILAQQSLGVVTLQGNTDERGSEEYNLALGERRAVAAKRYLTDLGVPAQRLRTVSFGEAKPAVAGHDESAWKWNRRVDFAVNR